MGTKRFLKRFLVAFLGIGFSVFSAQAEWTVNTDTLNLRNMATSEGSNTQVLARLPRGTRLVSTPDPGGLTEYNNNGTRWVHVQVEGTNHSGWVVESFLSAGHSGEAPAATPVAVNNGDPNRCIGPSIDRVNQIEHLEPGLRTLAQEAGVNVSIGDRFRDVNGSGEFHLVNNNGRIFVYVTKENVSLPATVCATARGLKAQLHLSGFQQMLSGKPAIIDLQITSASCSGCGRIQVISAADSSQSGTFTEVAQ